MNASLGHFIESSWTTLKSSTREPYVPFLRSTGRTASPTLRYSTDQSPLVLKYMYSSKPSFDGWVTSYAWRNLDCPSVCYTANVPAETGTKKRFKDWIKTCLPFAGVSPRELEESAADRDNWRRAVHQAGENHEAAFRQKQIKSREKRHNKVPHQGSSPWSIRNRSCGSKIGLHSHRKKHY